MSTAAGILLALAIGSVALFSTLFLVILFMTRNRWQQLADSKQPHTPSQDHSDA